MSKQERRKGRNWLYYQDKDSAFTYHVNRRIADDWVSVEERLPKAQKGVYYLCRAVGHYIDYLIVCSYHGKGTDVDKYDSNWVDRYGNQQLVTHWQPITSPKG